MSLRAALAAAAADFYSQSWRLAILNSVLGLVVAAVALATAASRSALALALLAGPLAAAVMHCAVTLAQTEELRLGDALFGLRRHWRRGLALGALLVGAGIVGVVVVPFYAHAGVWAWPLAAVSLYLLLMFALVQLALWPLAVYERDRPFREVVRQASIVVVRRPAGFVGLGIALLLVNVAGVAAAILPFLTLTIAYSFLVAAHYALPRSADREL